MFSWETEPPDRRSQVEPGNEKSVSKGSYPSRLAGAHYGSSSYSRDLPCLVPRFLPGNACWPVSARSWWAPRAERGVLLPDSGGTPGPYHSWSCQVALVGRASRLTMTGKMHVPPERRAGCACPPAVKIRRRPGITMVQKTEIFSPRPSVHSGPGTSSRSVSGPRQAGSSG